MKRLILDLDGTITHDNPLLDYMSREPNKAVVNRISEYRALGFEICIHSARNMRTYQQNLGKINARTLPGIVEWLERNAIPFDEIHVGKPWCGSEGFYVDDKAIRPSEFIKLNYGSIIELLNCETISDNRS